MNSSQEKNHFLQLAAITWCMTVKAFAGEIHDTQPKSCSFELNKKQQSLRGTTEKIEELRNILREKDLPKVCLKANQLKDLGGSIELDLKEMNSDIRKREHSVNDRSGGRIDLDMISKVNKTIYSIGGLTSKIYQLCKEDQKTYDKNLKNNSQSNSSELIKSLLQAEHSIFIFKNFYLNSRSDCSAENKFKNKNLMNPINSSESSESDENNVYNGN